MTNKLFKSQYLCHNNILIAKRRGWWLENRVLTHVSFKKSSSKPVGRRKKSI